MYTYDTFQRLISDFDASVEDKVIKFALRDFISSAGYSVLSVEKFLQLDETRFFRINFESEDAAIMFMKAYHLASDKCYPLHLGFRSVSIVVV